MKATGNAATFILLASLAGTGGTAMAIEQPTYRVVDRNGDIEIREYDGYIVAETFVEGAFDEAGNEGFRRLFRYITGSNQARAEISMTAPVAQTAAGQKIAMTAPVAQMSEAAGYWVSFVVPAEFTMDTAPQPTDPRVRLRAVPSQTMAALRYSGFWSEQRYQREKQRLRELMAERGLVAVGEPQFARYNPPFMPPFMRRNEILMPLSADLAVQPGADRLSNNRATAMTH